MRIHKEGIAIILIVLALITSLNLLFFHFIKNGLIQSLLVILSISFFFLVVWFFRNPSRPVDTNPLAINCPADGRIVAAEPAFEDEYFRDSCLQVSIFMSPLNVHLNRYPVSGTVCYARYHPGKYLVAWHPKSSLLNERSTVVIRDDQGREVLVRQIAGAVARRIITYSVEGQRVEQGGELGFIRFGSRVDLFLPPGTKLNVKIGQNVRGNRTILGYFESAR